MRVNIVSNGNEVTIRGNVNFIANIMHAIEVQEGKQERKTMQETTFQTEEEKEKELGKKMLESLAKAREAKKLKSIQGNRLPSGKKRPKRHRAPRWTKEENDKLWEFLNDEQSYRWTRGKMCVHSGKMKQLARELRRSTKAVSLRIQGVPEYKKCRDYMCETLLGKRSRMGGEAWNKGFFGN